MNTPKCSKILECLGVDPNILCSSDISEVKISVGALKSLLRHIAILNYSTDEEYIACNEDVGAALARGDVTNLRSHFIDTGFFEGRTAKDVQVDEHWYLSAYPDVKKALDKGIVPSAQDHFSRRGEIEWRAPDAESEISYDIMYRAASAKL